MNLIFKITLNSMLRNKKRTLVTIIGVIISIAMVSGVSTIYTSFLDLMQQMSMETNGNWHSSFEQVSGEYIPAFKDENIEHMIISKTIGYAALEERQNTPKPYVYISSYEANSIGQLPIRLIDGEFPKNEREIMIPSSLLTIKPDAFQIGNTVTYQVGNRVIDVYKDRYITQNYAYQQGHETLQDIQERTYQITGIYDDRMLYQSTTAGYDLISGFMPGDYEKDSIYNVKVKFAHPTNAIYEYTETKAREVQSESYGYNTHLLMASGINTDTNFIITMYCVIAVIGMIMFIGSVSLIYNAFAISLSERSRYLGMLSSIGATKRQKRWSVFYEAAIIAVIAIPLGFLAGYLGMQITFQCVEGILFNTLLSNSFGDIHLRLVVERNWFFLALVFSIMIIFASAWRPACRASKISPMDAIRQSTDMQIKRKHVKTLHVTRKIFGFEAELALKNMKRHHSRYRTTLCSLIISMVLFLCASAVQEMIQRSYSMTMKTISGNIELHISNFDHSTEADEYVKEVLQMSDVSSASAAYQFTVFIDYPKDIATQEALAIAQEHGYLQMMVNITAYDEQTLQRYCKDLSISCDELNKETLSGILVNHVTYKDYHDFKELNMLQVKPEELLHLQAYNHTTNAYQDVPFNIAYVSELLAPLMDHQVEGLDTLNIVISKQAFHQLQEKMAPFTQMSQTTVTLQADDPYAAEERIREINHKYPQFISSINNYERIQTQQEQMSIFILVFLYGFVALILFISCANIFNTITTGIALRKQEFAMLKSVGMTPRKFQIMLCYENIFYGVKAICYGIPISCAFSYLLYKVLERNFDFPFFLPWKSILYSIIGIFCFVLIAMCYALRKVKGENLIDAIKEESL